MWHKGQVPGTEVSLFIYYFKWKFIINYRPENQREILDFTDPCPADPP